jgi:hypothetical protein
MNDPDTLLRERYAKEADDVLFRDLEMDERLKARIRAQWQAEAPTGKSGGHRPKAVRRRRLYSLVSAAAVVLLVAALQFGDRGAEAPPDTGMERGTVMSNAPEGSDLAAPMSTFAGPEGVEPAAVERTVATIADAQALFAGRLLVPAAVPDGYALAEIRAYGAAKAQVDAIVLRYADRDEGEFTLTARLPEAEPLPGGPNAGEPVRIGSAQGYMRTDGDGSIELSWTADGTVYVLKSRRGNPTAEQLLAIAENLMIPGGNENE